MPIKARRSALRSLLCWLLLASTIAQGGAWPLPPPEVSVVGEVHQALLAPGDSLVKLARRERLGQNALRQANPGVDRWLPDPQRLITLPTRFVLPDAPRHGIVINLPEMRLYLYGTRTAHGIKLLRSWPVSIGRQDWNTPLGELHIVNKIPNPTWTPPESIREEAAARGHVLPSVVPAGPNNPLGLFALRLNHPGYLIHGTNKPDGIGMRVTHGCIRLYPEDIATLFDLVPTGTPVQIVNQPLKLGWNGNRLYLEVHPPLFESGQRDRLQAAVALLRSDARAQSLHVRLERLRQVVKASTGLPALLTVDQPRISGPAE